MSKINQLKNTYCFFFTCVHPAQDQAHPRRPYVFPFRTLLPILPAWGTSHPSGFLSRNGSGSGLGLQSFCRREVYLVCLVGLGPAWAHKGDIRNGNYCRCYCCYCHCCYCHCRYCHCRHCRHCHCRHYSHNALPCSSLMCSRMSLQGPLSPFVLSVYSF